MSIPDQQNLASPKITLNDNFGLYSRTLTRGSNVVNSQANIKQQYTPVRPNGIPFWGTDGIKGGFQSQQIQPFSAMLLDRPVGNMFIEEHRLIDRRMNPFLTKGDLSADIIARQF